MKHDELLGTEFSELKQSQGKRVLLLCVFRMWIWGPARLNYLYKKYAQVLWARTTWGCSFLGRFTNICTDTDGLLWGFKGQSVCVCVCTCVQEHTHTQHMHCWWEHTSTYLGAFSNIITLHCVSRLRLSQNLVSFSKKEYDFVGNKRRNDMKNHIAEMAQ